LKGGGGHGKNILSWGGGLGKKLSQQMGGAMQIFVELNLNPTAPPSTIKNERPLIRIFSFNF